MKFREQRWPCDFLVQVGTATGRLRARLGNVAARGAMIRGLGYMPTGTAVTLSLPGSELRAEVRWSTDARCGVRFARALSPRELGMIRRQVGHMPHDRWSAPGRMLREMR